MTVLGLVPGLVSVLPGLVHILLLTPHPDLLNVQSFTPAGF